MDKITQNSFTYGFEIEGLFSKSVINKLNGLCSVDRKTDGSVHGRDIASTNRIDLDDIEGGSYWSPTELGLGVFSNIKSLLEVMGLFINKKTYFMDESCGLHLHIKAKELENREVFWDLPLIKKLEEFAFTELCNCQKKRKDNRFCLNYGAFRCFYSDIVSKTKYRFVRNHPSGTMEFRFFCPCEHKVENVEKFLNYTFELLNQQEPKKSIIVNLNDHNTETQEDFSFVLSANLKDQNYNFSLNVPPPRIDREFRRPTRRPSRFAPEGEVRDIPF